MEATPWIKQWEPFNIVTVQILQDSRNVFFFHDIKHVDSPMHDAVEVLSNSKELPVLFHKGCVVGAKAIREYIGSTLLIAKTTHHDQILVALPLVNITGGIELDSETGEWLCPLCYSVVHIEQDDGDQMFDDDEDDGEVFENDSTFTSEGDRLITFTKEERLRIAELWASRICQSSS